MRAERRFAGDGHLNFNSNTVAVMLQLVIGLVVGFVLNQVIVLQQRRWSVRDDERRYDRERIAEETRWRRDRRAEAYLEVSRSVDNFFYVAMDVCPRLPARDELNLAMRRLDEANAAVCVLGTAPGADAAQILAVAGYQVFGALYNAEGPIEYATVDGAREFHGAHGVFDRVVRGELSDPGLKLPDGLADAAERSRRFESDLHELWGDQR